jgi:hypothetical protein
MQLCIPNESLFNPLALFIALAMVLFSSKSLYEGICMNMEDNLFPYHHLPSGHTAFSSFTFSFIKQPHSLHCLVAFSRLGHASHIAYRADEMSSAT